MSQSPIAELTSQVRSLQIFFREQTDRLERLESEVDRIVTLGAQLETDVASIREALDSLNEHDNRLSDDVVLLDKQVGQLGDVVKNLAQAMTAATVDNSRTRDELEERVDDSDNHRLVQIKTLLGGCESTLTRVEVLEAGLKQHRAETLVIDERIEELRDDLRHDIDALRKEAGLD